MRPVEIDLGRLAQEVRADVMSEAPGRQVTWRVGELPSVRGDLVLVRLVLRNLFANAVKFTRNRPDAEVEVGACSGGGEHVVFVRDNGVGFDPKYVNKLFGVFQRLHRAEEFEGTGIGLALCRRIIARHGGRTWAEGVPGAGATIYFTLPEGAEP
jgi:light-regulated signal transduction histidine kinase (bacteriophytochrome)